MGVGGCVCVCVRVCIITWHRSHGIVSPICAVGKCVIRSGTRIPCPPTHSSPPGTSYGDGCVCEWMWCKWSFSVCVCILVYGVSWAQISVGSPPKMFAHTAISMSTMEFGGNRPVPGKREGISPRNVYGDTSCHVSDFAQGKEGRCLLAKQQWHTCVVFCIWYGKAYGAAHGHTRRHDLGYVLPRYGADGEDQHRRDSA